MVIAVWLARKITSEVIMHRGYIKLWRCIQDNNLWTDEPFDKARAWIDLVMLANYKDATIQRRGIKVLIKRGEVGTGYRELADRWKWSIGKVQRFMQVLKADTQIDTRTDTENCSVTTLIVIVNYENYQDPDTSTDEKQIRKQVQTKKDKKIKKETLPNEKTIRPISDCIEQQIVLWWSISYEKIMGRPYQIAWSRDMDCAKKLMEIAKGDKKNAIIAGCQLLNEEREAKTLTNLSNGYWNRRPPAVDSMAIDFIAQDIFPPMRTTLKDWLTEKINGAN
jgi:hypothetical protein